MEKFWRLFGIKAVYKWELKEDFEYLHPYFVGISFESDFLKIEDGLLTIRAGYAWNGCSPKYSLWGFGTVGTYDGEIHHKTGKQKAYYPSLVHDALYQYKAIGRKKSDIIFREMLEYYEFQPAPIYYRAVRIFGAMKKWDKNPQD